LDGYDNWAQPVRHPKGSNKPHNWANEKLKSQQKNTKKYRMAWDIFFIKKNIRNQN